MSTENFEMREEGRRLVAETPYDEGFVEDMRSLNANWDADEGVWWVGKTSSDDKIEKFRTAFKACEGRYAKKMERKNSFKAECDRRRQEGLALKVPYDHRHLAKEHDGIWDGKAKKWLMPNEEAKTEVESELTAIAERARRRKEQERKERKERKRQQKRERICEAVGVDDYDAVIAISGGGEHRGRMPSKGRTFRSKKHGIVTIAHVEGPNRIRDARSFGYNFDDGWTWTIYCREATEEEAAPVLEEEDKRRRRREALNRRAELEARLREEGECPDPEDGSVVLDEELCEHHTEQRLYGGGSWFGLTEDHLWFVRNNGADGDTWARNNVRTGGAGAIGWRIRRDEDLVEELRELETILEETA